MDAIRHALEERCQGFHRLALILGDVKLLLPLGQTAPVASRCFLPICGARCCARWHRGHPRPEQKQLSQESAVGVRWLLVLSVCLLALDHCESTTFAIFQRLQPRNQPKTLDSAQDLPSNQKMSRKDLSAGNCRALKNSCSVQSITRVDWDTTCLPRHAVGQNKCLHS